MIVTWSQGSADECMSEDILTELAHLIRRHPWWRARASLMLALLKRTGVRPPARVLDAGCGWGVNLDVLERHGYRVAGLDISRQILERLDRPDRQLIEADLSQALPESTEQYDAVVSLDVIEHVDEDHTVVSSLGKLAKPGGVILVSVPALPSLYSEFDAIQGHRRRYLPESLLKAFEPSALQVEDILWWGSWMVPILRRRRSSGRSEERLSAADTYKRYLKLPPWPFSLALRLAFAFDKIRTLHGNPSQGTSLFAVARRSPTPAHSSAKATRASQSS